MTWDFFDGIGWLSVMVSLVSGLMSIIPAVWSKVKKRPLHPALLVASGALISIPLALLLINPLLSSASPRIQVTSIEYTEHTNPTAILVAGSYNDAAEDKGIWLYLKANDGRYHFRRASKNKNAWESMGKLDIGGKSKADGKYDVGIVMGSAEGCTSPKDAFALDGMPDCLVEAGSILVIRK